jgi:hypothetical protein
MNLLCRDFNFSRRIRIGDLRNSGRFLEWVMNDLISARLAVLPGRHLHRNPSRTPIYVVFPTSAATEFGRRFKDENHRPSLSKKAAESLCSQRWSLRSYLSSFRRVMVSLPLLLSVMIQSTLLSCSNYFSVGRRGGAGVTETFFGS